MGLLACSAFIYGYLKFGRGSSCHSGIHKAALPGDLSSIPSPSHPHPPTKQLISSVTQFPGDLPPNSDLSGHFMSMDTDVYGMHPYTYELKDSFLIMHMCMSLCVFVHVFVEVELDVGVSCLVPGTNIWPSVRTVYAFIGSHFSSPLKDI